MIQIICYESDLRELTAKEVVEGYGLSSGIDSLDSFGDTLLIAACKNKQMEYVKYCLAQGANPDYINKCGESPIHVLIDTVLHDESQSISIVKLLLDSGADIEIRAYMDKTPYLRACSRNSFAMIKLLVERGCDTNAVVKEYDYEVNGIWFSECFHLPTELREYIKSVTNS